MKNYIAYLFTFYFFVFFASLTGIESYQVNFEGDINQETLQLLRSSSQLTNLKNTPPATLKGLKRRAEADMENLIQALQSLAYYNPYVTFKIDTKMDPIQVNVFVQTGPVYSIADFRLLIIDTESSPACMYELVKLQDLGICLNEPAFPKKILEAEDTLLESLNLKGYPFAKIEKREVVADQATHAIFVTLRIDLGPQAFFGPITISGQRKVQCRFFDKKIAWCDGELFNPKKIEKTQEALEATGLFSSVAITSGNELNDDGYLPIHIEISEAKMRSIGLGLNYSTDLGPGISAEWEHRNLNGAGQRLSVRADLWKKEQHGTLRIVTPDFKCPKQDLIFLAEFGRESIEAFTDFFMSVSSLIEKEINEKTRFSYGVTYKNLRSSHTDNNRVFNLVKIPLHYRWSNANNALDPTKGGSISLKIVPTAQIFTPKFVYSINTFTGTYYQTLTSNQRFILATKLMLGSINGPGRKEIPPPERFYAGSENTLRGYSYMTVSPLNKDHDPIGGRSLAILSIEPRIRIGENFGFVLFYDIGNVYSDSLPNFTKKQLQGIGLGIRYYTAIGPLRLDLAFPLNRRHHVDGTFQAYFSIGQSF